MQTAHQLWTVCVSCVDEPPQCTKLHATAVSRTLLQSAQSCCVQISVLSQSFRHRLEILDVCASQHPNPLRQSSSVIGDLEPRVFEGCLVCLYGRMQRQGVNGIIGSTETFPSVQAAILWLRMQADRESAASCHTKADPELPFRWMWADSRSG
eukprot:4183923-Amphidinium_carterae.1